jgi:HEAT repeat protein
LAFAATSDSLVHFALVSGTVAMGLVLVLLLAIVCLRVLLRRRSRHLRALSQRWEPVFCQAISGGLMPTARLLPGDHEIVLTLWLRFSESIRGEARQGLRRLALHLGLDYVARDLLQDRALRSQLLAVVALGRLECADAWKPLLALSASPNSILSLAAARSLLHINPVRSLPHFMKSLSERTDWPRVRIAAIVEEIPPDLLAPPLRLMLRKVDAGNASRLLWLLDIVRIGDTWPLLAPLLQAGSPPPVLVAALKVCNDPRGLEDVRLATAHAEWVVRAQAASALGRIGIAEDRLRLQAMLSDPVWWVRYRASLALIRLPFVTRQRLLELCAQLDDRFAADILRQALAESDNAGVRR